MVHYLLSVVHGSKFGVLGVGFGVSNFDFDFRSQGSRLRVSGVRVSILRGDLLHVAGDGLAQLAQLLVCCGHLWNGGVLLYLCISIHLSIS